MVCNGNYGAGYAGSLEQQCAYWMTLLQKLSPNLVSMVHRKGPRQISYIGFKISIQNGKLTACSWHTLVKVLPLEPHTGSKIPGQTSGHPGKNVQNSGNYCSFGGNAVFVKTELMI